MAGTRRPGVTVDQARTLLAAVDDRDGSHDPRLAALWRLLLSVPLRPGEPLAATWADMDLDAGMYEVRRNLVRVDGQWRLHDCKGHRARTVPLASSVVTALRRHRAAQAAERLRLGVTWQGADVVDVDGRRIRPDLVFTYPDGSPLHETWLRRDLIAVCRQAGVPVLTPHGLRHAAVTLLQAQGVHPAVVQQLAGHASLRMTDHYTGRLDPAARDAVTLLDATLTQQ